MVGRLHVNGHLKGLEENNKFTFLFMVLESLPSSLAPPKTPPILHYYFHLGLHPGLITNPHSPPNHLGIDEHLLQAIQANPEGPPFPGNTSQGHHYGKLGLAGVGVYHDLHLHAQKREKTVLTTR